MTLPPAARAWVRLAWIYVAIRLAAAVGVLIAVAQVALVTGWLRWE